MAVVPFFCGVGALAGSGMAAWQTWRRLNKARTQQIQEFQAAEAAWEVKPGWLLLGEYQGNPVWFSGSEMGVTIGSTGSQKFTAAVAPNLLMNPGSCFVVDPKGEICAVTASARQRGQTVYRLDPFNKTYFAPGAFVPPLASFNPLDALDSRDPAFISDVVSLAEALFVPQRSNSDPFWSNSAKELVIALMVFVCYHRDAEGERNLTKVLDYLSSNPERWEWLYAEMAKSDFAVVRGCGQSHQGLAPQTRSGIIQQARTETSFLAYPEIAAAVRSSSFRLDELFTGFCTVYVVLPAERLTSHSRWLRLMLAVSLLTAARYKKTDVPLPVLWLIDEAAQLGRLDDIPKAYGLMRGYGVRVWTFWQDLGQLKATYPEQWSSLLGNSFNQVMACGDEETAKYFANLAGKHEVIKTSYSSSSGNSRSYQSSSTNSSASTTTSKQWEERIQIDQLLAMPPTTQLIRLPNQLPFFCGKWQYHQDGNLNAAASPNPYYQRP